MYLPNSSPWLPSHQNGWVLVLSQISLEEWALATMWAASAHAQSFGPRVGCVGLVMSITDPLLMRGWHHVLTAKAPKFTGVRVYGTARSPRRGRTPAKLEAIDHFITHQLLLKIDCGQPFRLRTHLLCYCLSLMHYAIIVPCTFVYVVCTIY